MPPSCSCPIARPPCASPIACCACRRAGCGRMACVSPSTHRQLGGLRHKCASNPRVVGAWLPRPCRYIAGTGPYGPAVIEVSDAVSAGAGVSRRVPRFFKRPSVVVPADLTCWYTGVSKKTPPKNKNKQSEESVAVRTPPNVAVGFRSAQQARRWLGRRQHA